MEQRAEGKGQRAEGRVYGVNISSLLFSTMVYYMPFSRKQSTNPISFQEIDIQKPAW
jgi:hypothetical protein